MEKHDRIYRKRRNNFWCVEMIKKKSKNGSIRLKAILNAWLCVCDCCRCHSRWWRQGTEEVIDAFSSLPLAAIVDEIRFETRYIDLVFLLFLFFSLWVWFGFATWMQSHFPSFFLSLSFFTFIYWFSTSFSVPATASASSSSCAIPKTTFVILML